MTLDIIKDKIWMMITFFLGGIILTSAISSNTKNDILPVEVSDPFIGEISIFAGNFPPKGWAFCNGQFVTIRGNPDLFSLLHRTFGGDGGNISFKLPDLRGRLAIHTDKKKSLNGEMVHDFGEKGGHERVQGMTRPIAAPLAGETEVNVTAIYNNSWIENRQPSLGLNFIIAFGHSFKVPTKN